MKKLTMVKFISVFFIVFSIFVTQAAASTDASLQTESAQALVKLGILTGYPDGSLGLQDKIKRSEFFTVVVRILGHEGDTGLDDVNLPFSDIKKTHWAYNNIKIAYKYKLITGNPDNTIAPNKYITYPEVLAVLIRALGYDSSVTGKWPDSVINKAEELGLTKNVDIDTNKQVTRGETSIIIYNALTVDLK